MAERYTRLRCEDMTVEYWIVHRAEQHYLLEKRRDRQVSLGVVTVGTLAHCEREMDLAVENVERAVGLGDIPFVIETERLDAHGKKSLRAFASPLAPTWAGARADSVSPAEQFRAMLREQLVDWKGAANALPITWHREWPRFHDKVVAAVRRKYGEEITLYRGVKIAAARQAEKSDILPGSRFSSWARSKTAARRYAGRQGLVIRATFAPEQIVLAPVRLGGEKDPWILKPLAHDVQHRGEELIVQTDAPFKASAVTQ